MRFRDRPLLVDGLDAALYLDRPELERRVVRPLLQDRNVLLLGEAGSGKSTLLRKSMVMLEELGRPTVLVNAAIADSAAEFLDVANAALRERLGDGRESSSGPGAGLMASARRLRRDLPAAILVDGLLDAEVGYDVFGRLRDELWELGHAWAVAVRPRDSAMLRTAPADAFWSAVVEIAPLSYEETERLLRLGLDEREFLKFDSDRVIAGAHPRSAIRDAQAVLEPGEAPSMLTAAQLLERAGRLGRSEAMAMAEVQGLGHPVSAHDADLLDRLGWSRAYAQRILSRLEDEGLLRSIPERSDRPGRPRKLYEPDAYPDNQRSAEEG